MQETAFSTIRWLSERPTTKNKHIKRILAPTVTYSEESAFINSAVERILPKKIYIYINPTFFIYRLAAYGILRIPTFAFKNQS